jgi:hypothetical protein
MRNKPQLPLPRAVFERITAFYEKVKNVKADVAAVLV